MQTDTCIWKVHIIFYIKTRHLVSSYTVFYDNAVVYNHAGKTIESISSNGPKYN